MAVLVLFAACAHTQSGRDATDAIVWRLDNLESIGGQTPEVLGAPRVVADEGRGALCFDGKVDGLFLPVNPIAGWNAFTVEVQLRPDGDGLPEQRFLHIEDPQGHRLLMETRVTGPRTWALDTFLRASDADKLTLLDRAQVQSTDAWHWAALVYDGATMRHYVDGQLQLEGKVRFPTSGPGRISLGVRQNRVYWFKGCLAQLRFTPAALPPGSLRQAN